MHKITLIPFYRKMQFYNKPALYKYEGVKTGYNIFLSVFETFLSRLLGFSEACLETGVVP